ncbi:MAG: hypothetical protein ACI9MC_003928 [Kiritimatiellia bacterium]|jgi:hypothetical protein
MQKSSYRSWILHLLTAIWRSSAALTHGITAAGVSLFLGGLALPMAHEQVAGMVIGELTPRQAWWSAGAIVLLSIGVFSVAVGCIGWLTALARQSRAQPLIALTMMAVIGVQIPWAPLLKINTDLAQGRSAQTRDLQQLLPAGPHRGVLISQIKPIIWPVSTRARVSSGFGWRHHPIIGGRRFHNGVDVAVSHGTQVHTAASGRVLRAKYDPLNGHHVVVRHDGGLRTAYCHLSTLQVVAGQRVVAGDTVGLSGASGRASGPHLHFGAWVRGRAVDPLRLVRRERTTGWM